MTIDAKKEEMFIEALYHITKAIENIKYNIKETDNYHLTRAMMSVRALEALGEINDN